MTKFKYIGKAGKSYNGLSVKEGDIVVLEGFFAHKAMKNPLYELTSDEPQETQANQEIQINQEGFSEEFYRQKAKSLGVKSYHNKKLDKLIKEVEELESNQDE